MRQAAEARDGVGGAGERLVEQRCCRRRRADRLAPGALVGGQFGLEQRLPRWRWSISKAFGRVTATDLMLASPGRVVRSKRRLGFWLRAVAFRPPSWLIVIFGAKGSVAQLTAWK